MDLTSNVPPVVQKLPVNKEDKEDTPAERVLRQIDIRLHNFRDKVEREVLKSILLRAGVAFSIISSSKKDKEFVIRE